MTSVTESALQSRNELSIAKTKGSSKDQSIDDVSRLPTLRGKRGCFRQHLAHICKSDSGIRCDL